MQTHWRYSDSVPPELKIISALLPARLLLPMPPPEHVPLWEGPAPEEGTSRVSGEPSRRKGSAHTSPEGCGQRHPARGPPPTSTRSFVSRRHKSRRYARSRSGLQCWQLIILKASQRPLIKVYTSKYIRISQPLVLRTQLEGVCWSGLPMARMHRGAKTRGGDVARNL